MAADAIGNIYGAETSANDLTKYVPETSALALCIAGLAQLPQISLPLATLDGCPLELSLIAARGNDTLLLELAVRLK